MDLFYLLNRSGLFTAFCFIAVTILLFKSVHFIVWYVGVHVDQEFVRFWDAIRNNRVLKGEDDVWIMPDGINWIGGHNRMYIRRCYIDLANQVLSETDGVQNISLCLSTGLKGIGKTMFLNYLITRIFEKHSTAAGDVQLPPIIYVCKEAEIQYLRFHHAGVDNIKSSHGGYFLSDSVDIHTVHTTTTRLYLLVASNNTDNYSSFCERMAETQHAPKSIHFDMPVWRYDELLFAHPISTDFTEKEALFLYDMFGGCVRYFHQGQPVANPTENVVKMCAEWFFPEDIRAKHLNTWNTAILEAEFRISKKRMGTDNPDVTYASGLFWDKKNHVFTSRFMEFLAGCLKEHAEASLWNALKDLFGKSGEGVAFEAIGHKKITTTDVTYTAYNLNTHSKPSSFSVYFYNCPRFLIRSVVDIATLPDGGYGLPLFGNFPIVDAVIKPNILLQFTISTTHGRHEDIEKYDEIRRALGSPYKTHRLIFIIKPEHIGEFKHIGTPGDLKCYYMTYLPLVTKKRLR